MHSKTEELILKTAKEIVVKFIETRTVTPATFNDHFQNIYQAVEKAINSRSGQDNPGDRK